MHICKIVGNHRITSGTNTQTYTTVMLQLYFGVCVFILVFMTMLSSCKKLVACCIRSLEAEMIPLSGHSARRRLTVAADFPPGSGLLSQLQSITALWPLANYFRAAWAMRKVSVCLSVCLSNACIVTKRKKDLSRFFLYYTNDHLD